jgi:UDP:flavonoid glycosyltransferase YjiC (YdhE family)
VARFLIATKPADGHVNPVLPVAKELVRRGHDVLWYTGSRFAERVEATGARRVPIVRGIDLPEGPGPYLEAHHPERAALRGLAGVKFDLKHFFHEAAKGEFADLTESLENSPVEAILADPASFGAFYVAERRALPCAIVSMVVLGIRSRDTAPLTFGLWPTGSALGRVRNRLLCSLTDLLLRDVSRFSDQIRSDLGLPPTGSALPDGALASCDLLLQATAPEFEYPRSDLPPHVRFIGPLLPDPPQHFTPPSWWRELEADTPVVLVTQGTARANPGELIQPTLEALAGESVLVVVTLGDTNPTALGRVPSNARVESFLSYHHLLPHVDAMVTNAGYGGVQLALAHGVPLVAAGRSEEKAEICARVAWSGVGIDLRRHSPSPRAIRRAVRAVIEQPGYRARARAMEARFAAYDAPQAAVDLLEELVQLDFSGVTPARCVSQDAE